MKRALTVIAVASLLVASPALAQLNNATGNNTGFVMKPMQWDLGDRPEAKAAMDRGGYWTIREHKNENPTLSPHPTIPEWIDLMTMGAGVGMINTHGNAVEQLVEAYPWTDGGKTKRDSMLTEYQRVYGNLVTEMNLDNVVRGIGIRYSALSAPTYVNFNQGIFQNQCCDGDQFPFIGGMSFACGPTGTCSIAESEENVKVFWESLQGLNGVANASAGAAMANAPQLTKIGGNDNTVLFPHPVSFSHASGTRVPDSGVLTVRLQTDCIMNTITVPATNIANATGDILVNDAWYSADNEISVALMRDPDVTDGEGWLKISGAWASLTGPLVTLDGGRDYDVRFIAGDGPAAEVTGFSVVSGDAEWQVGSEWHTSHYLVEGSPSPHGPWQPAAPQQPPGQGAYSVAVSGPGPYYRLVEVEEGVNAQRLVHGLVKEAAERKVVTDTTPPLADIREAFQELEAGRTGAMSAQSGQLMGGGSRMVIFTAGDSAVTDTYLADPWRWEGYTVSVVPVAGFPRGSNNEFQEYLKQATADSAGDGVDYFWLVGDAGDPGFAEQWSEHWEHIRQGYLIMHFDPMGQPENDEIPSWKFDDPEPRGVNWAYHNPYYYSDAPYWNTDDDSLRVPDVVGARLPFSDEASISAYGLKMAVMNFGFHGLERVTFLVDDQDHGSPGDSAFACQVADTVQSEVEAIETVAEVTRLNRSDELDDNANTDRTAAHLNVHTPNVVCMFGALSHRYFPGNYMDLTISNPWTFDSVDSPVSLVLAFSCGGGGFWRNEDPAHGVPVAHRALAHWRSGAVNWVGPGDGTNQAANRVLGIYTVQELAVADRPAAESFTVAMQRARADYGDRFEYVPSLDMYSFLGNPLSRVDQQPILVGVRRDFTPGRIALEQNVPNPFSAGTQIRYATGRPGRVRLRVYDAAGRLVRTLVDKQQGAGFHAVSWDGADNRGRRVASGVYFYQLVAPGVGRAVSKKMVLLK